MSPAMCIFGRPTRDLIPILPGKYHPHQTWRESLLAREEALRKRHMVNHEKWKEHSKLLPPLHIGDQVRIQNQTGPNPNKWDKTGTVIEVHQYHQYSIKVDGGCRINLRNRKFLRKYKPFMIRNQNEPFWKISPSFNQILQLRTHYPPPPPTSITTGSPNHPISSPEATTTDPPYTTRYWHSHQDHPDGNDLTTTGGTAILPTTNTGYPFTSTLGPILNQISTNQTQEINQDKETL